jgi:hypothetical protein
MSKKDSEQGKILYFPVLSLKSNLSYALSSASSGSETAQFSGQPGRSVAGRAPARENLQKAINRVNAVLGYWRWDFTPSLEAAHGAFRDMAQVVDLLQRAKSAAKNAGADTEFILRLDSVVASASDVRAQVRVLGSKLQGRRKPSTVKLADAAEDFERELNALQIALEGLLSSM